MHDHQQQILRALDAAAVNRGKWPKRKICFTQDAMNDASAVAAASSNSNHIRCNQKYETENTAAHLYIGTCVKVDGRPLGLHK